MKKKLIAVIALLFVCLAICKLYTQTNHYGVMTSGLSHIHWNTEDYALTYSDESSETSTELNLNDLESNIGKIVWQKDKQCIEITSINCKRLHKGEYDIYFRSHGVYDSNEGILTTAVKHIRVDENSFAEALMADMSVNINGISYPCERRSNSSIMHKDGDAFGFSFCLEDLLGDDFTSCENIETVEIKFKNLIAHKWAKIK